jgi:hypothetical protein
LGIGGDRVFMLVTWYSVISPESCFILWKSWEYKEQAAEALKLTSSDMKQNLIDDIIPEPLGGAHYDRETTFKTVQQYITNSYSELKELSTTDLIAQRMISTVKWVNIKSKNLIKELIRSLTVSDFFCYKQKKSLSTDICNKSTGIFFNFILLSLYGKLQNINPIKVDKTTIINLEKGKLPPQVLELEEAVLGDD